MKLSALKISFSASLLVHGAVCSIVSLAGSGQEKFNPQKEDEVALQIVYVPESDAPVASEKPVVGAEPRTTNKESIPVELTAPPPTETQESALPEIIPIISAPVGKLVSAEAPQASSGTAAPAVAPGTNVPSEVFPALAGESRGSAAGYLKNPQPIYPKEALRNRQEGLVVLSVFVAREGKPQLVKMLQSSSHALLDKAAIQAVKQWRFTPARTGNTAIASEVEVPIRFKMSCGRSDSHP
jgi:protein TonB